MMAALDSFSNGSSPDGRGTEAARHAMVVSQLRTSAVSDVRVVAAMAQVERERFLPATHGALAYRDVQVPLGEGRAQNAPLATGRLLTQARITPADRVLLIGAAGGYTAAVVARLAASVVAVECNAQLAGRAREALAGIPNVVVVEGPLSEGCSADAPYDVLVIDGAVEEVPKTLIAQLHPQARVVTGLIDRGVIRLASGVRTAGGFRLQHFADVDCVPLPGFEQPRGFQFPG